MSSGESSPPYEPSHPPTASTSMPYATLMSFVLIGVSPPYGQSFSLSYTGVGLTALPTLLPCSFHLSPFSSSNARCWLDSAADSGVYCPLARPFLFLCQTHEPRRNDGAAATVLLWLGDCLCRLVAEPHHVWGGRFVGYYVQAHCRAVSLGPRDGFG